MSVIEETGCGWILSITHIYEHKEKYYNDNLISVKCQMELII